MLYLCLHLGFNSLAPIIIYFWGQGINHDLLIFVSAITAVTSFHLLNYGQNKNTYQLIVATPRLWRGFSNIILTTTFMWVAGFIIPLEYSPFIFVFSYLGWPGFFGALIMAKTTKKPVYIIQAFMIGLTFILFYCWSFHDYTFIKAVIGIAVTMATGLSLYLYLRNSRRLNLRGINSRQILAVRYWLLLIFPLVVIIPKHEFQLLTLTIVMKCAIIGMITLVLPLYFGQLCIEKFGSEKFSLCMGFTPILTFLLQYLTFRNEFSQVIVAMLLALAITLPVLISLLSQRIKVNPV